MLGGSDVRHRGRCESVVLGIGLYRAVPPRRHRGIRESLAYGLCSGTMFASVLLWLASYARCMTGGNTLALLGNVAPTVTLMTSQVLRLVPQFVSRGRTVSSVHDGVRRCAAFEIRRRTCASAHRVGADGVGDGRRHRPYGRHARPRLWLRTKRTTYKRLRFGRADAVAMALIVSLALANAPLMAAACAQYAFYPTMSTLVVWWGYAVYGAFLIPAALRAKEWWQWRSSTEGYSFAYPAAQRGVRTIRRRGRGAPSRPWCFATNLQVEEGAFCAIVGDTGSGKTTLLRSLKPSFRPSACARACAHRGRAVVEDGFSALVHGAESAAQIGYVMQDPAARSYATRYGTSSFRQTSGSRKTRCAAAWRRWRISSASSRGCAGTESLSGGQQQIVNLAAVLALRPRLLLLDEPTAQLDPNALKQFLFLLARVNKELGITVVVATHAPEDMEAYATQTVVLGGTCAPAAREQAESAMEDRWRRRAHAADTSDAALEVSD
ncbi:MAG: ATP-binding cassette domain-containing protein, partial [Eggerthellaceae bacterium]